MQSTSLLCGEVQYIVRTLTFIFMIFKGIKVFINPVPFCACTHAHVHLRCIFIYHIAQLCGRENIGEFGESTAIRQYFTSTSIFLPT